MSCRCGPLLVAIACAAVRISGDQGTADLLALAYLGVLTLILHRGSDLQTAARVASSCNRLHPSRGSSGAYSVAH